MSDLGSCWKGCQADGTDIATIKCFECVFQAIIGAVFAIGGLLTLIMLLLGSFTYLTAGGDPKKAQTAANTLTYAVIGLVLLIVAWFILLFIEEFTGVRVTVFEIPID